MSGRYEKSGDPLTKGLSMAVALGALALVLASPGTSSGLGWSQPWRPS